MAKRIGKEETVAPKFDVKGVIVKRMDKAWVLSQALTPPVVVKFLGWERKDKE